MPTSVAVPEEAGNSYTAPSVSARCIRETMSLHIRSAMVRSNAGYLTLRTVEVCCWRAR
jgi:hypothetical protein